MQLKALCSGSVLWMALTGSVFAAQSDSVDQWLQRLQSAQSTQSYQGAFVYERKGAFTSHQVWRQVNAQGQLLERFVQLNGPEHEVMRVDGRVTCMSAVVADDLIAADIWPAQTFKLSHVQQWYDVHMLGETRVAGHLTSVLLFSPRDQHRYPVEIYVDQVTAIPLKTLLLNEHGELLERLQFIQFQTEPNQAQDNTERSAVIPSEDCLPIVTTKPAQTKEVDVDWNVSWTPPGFKLLKTHYKLSPDSNEYVLSQVYSDGVAHFSVFYENINNLEVEGGRHQLGPTAVVSRKVVRSDANIMVTVVGEVPIGSAERIALSMYSSQELSND